jgi:3-hydroxymyristoyl/3-hydroxydecanoyl-(acyl carrier protein) dehydratase
MTSAGLPHGYPFRFVDTVSEEAGADFSSGRVRARISANGRGAMGEAWRSPLLMAEAVAQAALLLEGGGSEAASRGYLAGLEGFEFARSPRAGDTLEIRVRLAGRFGAVAKFEGEVVSQEGESIARGAVLVRKGRDGSAAAREESGS